MLHDMSTTHSVEYIHCTCTTQLMCTCTCMYMYMSNTHYNYYWFLKVNTKAAGKAAIHCASVAGNMTVLKCLLEFDADLEVEVSLNSIIT